MALVAQKAAYGGAGAAGARTHHHPARDGMAFARHLAEHALRDVVVAAPVGGPLGIAELVHVMPAGLVRNRLGPLIDL